MISPHRQPVQAVVMTSRRWRGRRVGWLARRWSGMAQTRSRGHGGVVSATTSSAPPTDGVGGYEAFVDSIVEDQGKVVGQPAMMVAVGGLLSSRSACREWSIAKWLRVSRTRCIGGGGNGPLSRDGFRCEPGGDADGHPSVVIRYGESRRWMLRLRLWAYTVS